MTASEFYALPITVEMEAAAEESLTSPLDELVDGHLLANYSYFGAIDKTLSGFFVLDDEDDNYTLLDVRGDGAVWWQDHETRELYRQFDSLADWQAFRAEAAKDHDARHELRKAYLSTGGPAVTGRAPGTAALADRYQWLVWLLAQPLRDRDGVPTQSDDDLAASAVGQLRRTFPRPEMVRDTFRAELPTIADDPHLAIYWLLHTSLLAMEPQRRLVLDAIRPGTPLVDAFVATFGSLALAGEIAPVPGLRTRRALALMRLASHGPEEDRPREFLRALQMAPEVYPLGTATWIVRGLESGTITDEELGAVLGRVSPTAGTALLRAILDQRTGLLRSRHADDAVRLATGTGEPAPVVREALRLVCELAEDAAALEGAAQALLDLDPYHETTLAVVRRAQEVSGVALFIPPDELDRAMEIGVASGAVLAELVERPDDLAAILSTVEDLGVRRVVARRVLQRVGVDDYRPNVVTWAVRAVVESEDLDRFDLAARAVASYGTDHSGSVVPDLASTVLSVDDPVIPLLLRVLADAPAADPGDYGAEISLGWLNEAIVKALAPFAPEPMVFDALMRLAERPAAGTAVRPLWNELFSPFTEETYLLPRLTPAQAERVARAMVLTQLTHPDQGTRNAAGHQLYRFNHVGAEGYLIAALDEYGERFADNQPENLPEDALEDVVANLYSAVTNLRTSGSRAAVIERLFTERRSFWRLGSAIKDIFDDQSHAETLAVLRARRSGRAAGCYAYALDDHVERGAPKVELLAAIVDFPVPGDEVSRRFFAYALTIGIAAALEARAYELIRTAHAVLARIPEPPLEPDDHARGRGWTNPLEHDQREDLAAVLSGAAEAKRRRLLDKGVAARARGRPRRKISDRSLGILAGITLSRRLRHDRETGEVWFLDGDDRAHGFDGYEIAPAPFEVRPAGPRQLAAFLDGVRALSDRVLLWDRRAHGFVELVRYDDRVLYRWGVNNGQFRSLGLVFGSADDAAAAVGHLRDHQVAQGYAETSPWYVPGRGAVMRTYYQPKPDGGYSSERQYLMVFDRAAQRGGERFATEAEAIEAHERLDLIWQRDHNGSLVCLEWTNSWRRPEDMRLQDWISGRIRDDARDAVWHVRALTEITERLAAQGLAADLAPLSVRVGDGVTDDEIAVYERARTQPVPEVLRQFWREVGSAEWSYRGEGLRVLSPREMLAARPQARALGERYLAALTAERADAMRPALGALDVLVANQLGAPATVLADIASEDGRVFTHAYDDPGSLWWERSLSWMFSTMFGSLFGAAVVDAAPIVAMIYFGQPVTVRPRRWESDKRFWELLHDPTGMVATRAGKLGAVGAVKVKRFADQARADRRARQLIAAKEAEGYRPVSAQDPTHR